MPLWISVGKLSQKSEEINNLLHARQKGHVDSPRGPTAMIRSV
jgi:hypothetical protein